MRTWSTRIFAASSWAWTCARLNGKWPQKSAQVRFDKKCQLEWYQCMCVQKIRRGFGAQISSISCCRDRWWWRHGSKKWRHWAILTPEDNGQVQCDKLLTLKVTPLPLALSRFNWFNRLFHMYHAHPIPPSPMLSLAIRNLRTMTHTHALSHSYALICRDGEMVDSLKMLCFALLSLCLTLRFSLSPFSTIMPSRSFRPTSIAHFRSIGV